jgi:flagellin-like protein
MPLTSKIKCSYLLDGFTINFTHVFLVDRCFLDHFQSHRGESPVFAAILLIASILPLGAAITIVLVIAAHAWSEKSWVIVCELHYIID